jgi:DNA mismatch repair protein MutL
MNSKPLLNKLPPEIVNQIAAGEVIERPASVVKELVDNCIDAGAKKITIKLRDGGISLIEVSDDGVGIPKENLSEIFLAHTTSKLKNIDDLNTLMSMGFRGEALSTIVAVSKVSMISKYEEDDIGNKIEFNSQTDFKITSAPREKGTVIKVENIFENIPVRKKYLKTPQTEYKNILDTLTPYFLIYPNITWEVYKDDKQVINLISRTDTPKKIDKNRVSEVLKQDFVERMETVFYEGNGMKISGLSAHPSDHITRTKHQYTFVNGRSVWDSGIARSVLQGYERYIPHGQKAPFLINIDINPDQVDVNVHPRKEEVKFLNPYRVYSAVEQAVTKSIEKLVSYKNIQPNISTQYTPNFESKDISFGKSNSVNDSLRFSEAILQNFKQDSRKINTQVSFFESDNTTPIENSQKDYKQERIVSMHQIFNKYIIVEFDNELWMIDQHAAAERITFEKLSRLTEIQNTDTQNL